MRASITMVSALALALAASMPAAALEKSEGGTQASQATSARYSAAQFFETKSYGLPPSSGYSYSPDGRYLLHSSDETGVFNVYAKPLDGGQALQLTHSTTNANSPLGYFPKDGRILYAADGGGDELYHIYVRAEDGTVKDLTPGEKLTSSLIGWKADGSTFYVSTNERDASAFDVYAYDATTYERRMVFQNTAFYPGDITKDGKWLALSKPNTSADSDIYLVDLEAGLAPVHITPHDGSVQYNPLGFTPDSKRLIFGTNEYGEFNQAWTRELQSGAVAPLIQADWDVDFAFYSPTGRYRISALNADASTVLTILDTQTGKPLELKNVPAGSIGSVRFNGDESRVAFAVSSDTSPRDLFVADLSTGQATRLTHALNPDIKEADLVEATIIRYPAEGGVLIPSVLYKPKGASAANPAPAIVLVHGGPGGQTTRGYSAMVQHLVNHGYAVLGANNRGSSGYGKTFYHMDDRRHGEADLRDIVAGGDWLRAQDWVASDQVAVMGGSYGGYITAAALTFHPKAFEAGINIFGVTNWVRTLESIPPWWGAQRAALFDEMGDPAVDGERHRAISPLFHAEKIERPMLVVQGANDPRVLQIESDELVENARANGAEVEYVLFPDEGHGFARRENRITAQEAYLAFLNRYVRKDK